MKLTQCIKCIHQIQGRKCLAYPDGIPFRIFSGEVPHNQIFEGQINNYLYEPKDEYIEYDLKIKKGYNASLSELEGLKTEVAQLFYDNLVFQGINKKNWEFAKLDFELLNNRVGRLNELIVSMFDNTIAIDNFIYSELLEKVSLLVRIKASQSKCNRIIMTIFPHSPALFEFAYKGV